MTGFVEEVLVKTIEEAAEFDNSLFIGQDYLSIPDGQVRYWRVVIPAANVPAALLARDIFAFEGGGIEYRVFTQANATEVSVTPSPVFIPASGNPSVTFERVTGVTQTNPAEIGQTADIDWIAQSGTGNTNIGGSAGGQQVRIQPPSTVFYLSAENKNGVKALTFRLRLKWVEGAIVSKLFG